MSKTNWSKIVKLIMSAKPPRGKAAYTYDMVKAKTGISTSTLSRLSTGVNTLLYYDEGVKLMDLYEKLKSTNKIS